MTEREGPITELVNYPSSLFFLLFALRASILLLSFRITLLVFFLFSLLFPSVDPLYSYPLNQVVPAKVENNIHYYNHLCLVLSQMYNLKVIKHYELVCLQYVIHCKNTKLSMRIYKDLQGSTRIYKLHNFPPPKSLFE